MTYLGKAVEAIATADQLLRENWHPGEARYWRALNESQLDRLDEAWTDVEDAAKLLINSDVPKLAGIIAYRRRHARSVGVSRGGRAGGDQGHRVSSGRSDDEAPMCVRERRPRHHPSASLRSIVPSH